MESANQVTDSRSTPIGCWVLGAGFWIQARRSESGATSAPASPLGVLRVSLSGLPAGPEVRASNRPRIRTSGRWLVASGWLTEVRFLSPGTSHQSPATEVSGAVAQLGERLICIQEVAGSIPTSSTSS